MSYYGQSNRNSGYNDFSQHSSWQASSEQPSSYDQNYTSFSHNYTSDNNQGYQSAAGYQNNNYFQRQDQNWGGQNGGYKGYGGGRGGGRGGGGFNVNSYKRKHGMFGPGQQQQATPWAGRKGLGSVQKPKKKGNAFAHLEKFTSVQQLGLFAPEVVIEITEVKPNSPYFKAWCSYRGQTIEALQQTKKKAKQALCTKVIRKFKLLDVHRGAGASDSLTVGTHTEELSQEEVDKAEAERAAKAKPAKAEGKKAKQPKTEPTKMETQAANGEAKPDTVKLTQLNKNIKTPLSLLYETFDRNWITFGDVPESDERIPSHHTGFTILLTLPDGKTWVGMGRSKKLAQHHAAHTCLKEIKNLDSILVEGTGLFTGKISMPSANAVVTPKAVKTPEEAGLIGPGEYLKILNDLHPGMKEDYREEGTMKNKIFIASCTIDGKSYHGKGRAKKQAKKDMALRILREIHNYKIEGDAKPSE